MSRRIKRIGEVSHNQAVSSSDTHASPMSPPMSQAHRRDSSLDLDNAHDGSGDDEIQHESFARSSQSRIECLRPWTEAVNSIPLPEKAITLQKKCDRNYKRRRDDIKNKDRIIKQRLEKAMSDQLREMGNKDYEKVGRHGNDLFTKEALKASQDFVLSQSQSIENAPTDPNRMTREQWREIVDGVYGSRPIKKGRVLLSSAKVRTFSISRNIQSDSSVTSKRPCETSYVVAKIGRYLVDNVQPSMFFQFIPIITRELGGAQSTWDVVQRLSDCPSLKEILPESIYLAIFKIAFDEHEVHGRGEV